LYESRASMGTLVHYATERGVALLTLSDPPSNWATYELFRELDQGILEARFDDSVQVIVLTGQGDHAFCAGANLEILRETDAHFAYYFGLFAAETLARIENTPKLVLAALNGPAYGLGLDIALACDLRFARSASLPMGYPGPMLGATPGTGSIGRLVRLVGRSRATDLLCTNRTFDATEAKSWGLIHDVWTSDGYEAFVRESVETAHRMCAPHRPPLTLGRIKRALCAGHLEPGAAASLEAELAMVLAHSPDASEELVAALEGRPGMYRGQ
jgi:enoyl-CoA hydratase